MKVDSKAFVGFCLRVVSVIFPCFLLCCIAFFWQEDSPEIIFADKILVYLLTPAFLFLLYKLERTVSPIFVTRFRSRRDVLIQQLLRYGVCAVLYSATWLISISAASVLRYGHIVSQDIGAWFFRYILLWITVSQFSGLIEKLLPAKIGVLSYIIVYLWIVFEMLILFRTLPTGIGLIFTWVAIRNNFGLCTQLIWNVVLTVALVLLCEKEDIFT